MNIGFDIDDTITNSSEVFVKYAIEYNRMKNIECSNLCLNKSSFRTKHSCMKTTIHIGFRITYIMPLLDLRLTLI